MVQSLNKLVLIGKIGWINLQTEETGWMNDQPEEIGWMNVQMDEFKTSHKKHKIFTYNESLVKNIKENLNMGLKFYFSGKIKSMTREDQSGTKKIPIGLSAVWDLKKYLLS